jgi:hypothetical protein
MLNVAGNQIKKCSKRKAISWRKSIFRDNSEFLNVHMCIFIAAYSNTCHALYKSTHALHPPGCSQDPHTLRHDTKT